MDKYAVRRAHVLRAPVKATVWPGEYIELDLPPELRDVDCELAVEPHADASAERMEIQQWPVPTLTRAVAGKIRVPNLTGEPRLIPKNLHLCRVRATYVPVAEDTL